MRLTRLHLLACSAGVLLVFGSALASAQTYEIGQTGDSQSLNIYGQGFTPSEAGGFDPAPGASQVSLLSIAFAKFNVGTPPVSVYILEESILTDAPNLQTMIATVLATPGPYVLGQSGSAVVTPGLLDGTFPGSYNTLTYTFTGGVTLDAGTRYVTLFSNGATSVRVMGNGTFYAAGSVYDATGFDEDFDAGFIATFSVIPEPASTAALAGLLVCSVALFVRRRRIGVS